MKAARVRDLGDADLVQQLDDARQELFNLRFSHVTGQLDNATRPAGHPPRGGPAHDRAAGPRDPRRRGARGDHRCLRPTTTESTERNRRKTREGMVVGTKMDKTAIVAVTDRVRHRRYDKTVQRVTKLYVHDEENTLNEGDRVRVAETRPLSKNKRWRLLEIVERAR